jgi:hypothetical protein
MEYYFSLFFPLFLSFIPQNQYEDEKKKYFHKLKKKRKRRIAGIKYILKKNFFYIRMM